MNPITTGLTTSIQINQALADHFMFATSGQGSLAKQMQEEADKPTLVNLKGNLDSYVEIETIDNKIIEMRTFLPGKILGAVTKFELMSYEADVNSRPQLLLESDREKHLGAVKDELLKYEEKIMPMFDDEFERFEWLGSAHQFRYMLSESEMDKAQILSIEHTAEKLSVTYGKRMSLLLGEKEKSDAKLGKDRSIQVTWVIYYPAQH